MRQLLIISAIFYLAAAFSGCSQFGCCSKRASEMECPTDIRKTHCWCFGEDALFQCPCGPDAAGYGYQPTCWREWSESGAEWSDSGCWPQSGEMVPAGEVMPYSPEENVNPFPDDAPTSRNIPNRPAPIRKQVAQTSGPAVPTSGPGVPTRLPATQLGADEWIKPLAEAGQHFGPPILTHGTESEAQHAQQRLKYQTAAESLAQSKHWPLRTFPDKGAAQSPQAEIAEGNSLQRAPIRLSPRTSEQQWSEPMVGSESPAQTAETTATQVGAYPSTVSVTALPANYETQSAATNATKAAETTDALQRFMSSDALPAAGR
jgi:hypothetical protein